MEEDDPVVITLTDDDLEDAYDRIMEGLPYRSPGALRDAVFQGGQLCCSGCYEYAHPHAEAWRAMDNWLFLAGEDWRNVE